MWWGQRPELLRPRGRMGLLSCVPREPRMKALAEDLDHQELPFQQKGQAQ